MRKLNFNFLTGLLTLCSLYVTAQQTYVNKDWEYIGGIPGQYDYVQSKLHSNGNLILVGNNSTNGQTDILITALNIDGTVAWQQTNSGANGQNDYGTDLAIDNTGNIYVCGAVHNGSNTDYRILKYSTDGVLIWTKQYNGSGNGDDVPVAIRIDANNNIYVTGTSTGSGTLTDFATLKYDQSGTLFWTKRYNYSNLPEIATCLEIDNSGNVFVAGASANNLNNSDFCVVKYNSSGTQMAVQRHATTGNGYDLPAEMTINSSGNVFIVGTSEAGNNKNVKLIAFTNTLTALWAQYIDQFGRDDEGYSITLTPSNNLVITGYSKKQSGGTNLIVAKYTLTGTQVWLKNKTAIIDNEIAKGRKVRVNSNGKIFLSGESFTDNSRDFVTQSYDENGNILWEKTFDNLNTTEKAAQLVVSNEDVYITGTTSDGNTDQLATVKYSAVEKPYSVAGSGDTLWNAGEIIIRFDTSAINKAAIDKIGLVSGTITEFVKTSVLTELSNKTGFNWYKMNAFKVHPNLTTKDTISISRLGDTIRLPFFCATLSVFIPENINEQQTIDSINTLFPLIHYSTRNFLSATKFSLSNDPLLNSEEQTSLIPSTTYPYANINIDPAWNISTGEDFIKVGIFDEPVYWAHEDFGNGTFSGSKFKDGWDYYTDSHISNINFPQSSHGTSCAGIIGAFRNNSIGIAGIAGGDIDNLGNRGVSLYSYGIFHDDIFVSTSNVAAAIVRGSLSSPIGDELHVQNHSWGGTINSPDIEEAVLTCWLNGCSFVVARGNNYGTTYPEVYPALYKDEAVLCVGASGTDGKYIDCYPPYNGDGWWCNMNNYLINNQYLMDFIAPGTTNNVSSTIYSGTPYSYPNACSSSLYPNYQCFNGTSASAPHVSGVAALMYSRHHIFNSYQNNLAPEDIENILQSYSYNYSSPGNYTVGDGYGLIDAGKSLEMINSPYYRINHSGGMPTSVNVSNLTPNINCVVKNNIWNSSLNGYTGPLGVPVIADQYLVTLSYNDVFGSTESGFDYWKRLNNTKGVDNLSSGEIIGDPWFLITSPSYSGNTFSANMKTYCYHIKTDLNGNTIDKWIPCHWSELRTYYSVHIVDNAYAQISENNLDDDVLLYPIPAQNDLFIEFSNNISKEIRIEIFDITGRCEYSNIFDSQEVNNYPINIDINYLKSGMYLCRITSNKKVTTKSFSKQ